MFELLTDVFADTFIDSVKLLPFLYLAYLLLEWIEHRAGSATEGWLKSAGKIGPLLGGTLGLLPQCGFSAAASGLYAGRIITTGTLIAVYLSTSDEMLPILLLGGDSISDILLILGLKFAIGVAAGFAVDFLSRQFFGPAPEPTASDAETHCKEHCKYGVFLNALFHTLKIWLFLFLFSFVLGIAVSFLGEELLKSIMPNHPIPAVFASILIGLIPNCASSVLLTQLYLDGFLQFAPLVAGLLVNAGIGFAVLFRKNRPVKDSFRILAIVVGVSVVSGLLLSLL